MKYQICDASCGVPSDDTLYDSYAEAVQAVLESSDVIICEADEEESDDES